MNNHINELTNVEEIDHRIVNVKDDKLCKGN